jgi:acyl carrier protein
MNATEDLHNLLAEFFGVPSSTAVDQLNQRSVSNWDSLAMVQLITEVQSAYNVNFELDEIERLTSYSQIRDALLRKGVMP